MSNFERKFGKYAIKNLTIKLILCYVIGYILYYAPKGANILGFLTLNPALILHGQVWRLVTWILVPPVATSGGNIFLTLIMLYFYYSIGTTMENVWGTYKYNLYILTGFLLMIISSIITYVVVIAQVGGSIEIANVYMADIALYYMTSYYINMSILLAFAATFPDNVVLFMFIIPLKMKWLGIFYGVYLVFEAFSAIFAGAYYKFFPIVASLLTFGIFWLTSGRFMHLRPREVKRRNDFKKSVKIMPKGVTKHKCAFCGKTDEDDPNLEFRFCSKCNGNYEYCQDHLFTHVHVK